MSAGNTEFSREISRRISGRTVDISTAHNYYLVLWESVRQGVSRELRRQGSRRYQASVQFFRCFEQHLRQVVAQRSSRSTMNAADLIVIALFRASLLFRRPEELSRYVIFRDWLTKPRPSSLRRLMGFPVTQTADFDYPCPMPPKQPVVSGEREHSTTSISFTCNEEGGTEPFVIIEIEGFPIGFLTRAFYSRHSRDRRRAIRKEAKRFWAFLLEKLYVLTGTKNPRGGRPAETYIAVARFYRHICGLSWREIAEELCQKEEKHSHGLACRERFRKAVEEYEKRIQKREPVPVSPYSTK